MEMINSTPFFTDHAHDLFLNSMPGAAELGFDQMVRLFADEDARLQLPPGDCHDEFVPINYYNGAGFLGDQEAAAAGFSCSSALEQGFGFYSPSEYYYSCSVDPCSQLLAAAAPAASRDGEGRGMLLMEDDDVDDVDEDDDDDDGESSGTAAAPRPARDRARTLVSERKRRGRMKEKLYELRSLVPNITKMDKASIIGDAIMYIRDLQRQARSLTEEIAVLEEYSPVLPTPQTQLLQSPAAAAAALHGRRRPAASRPDRDVASSTVLPGRKGEILQFTACEVGDRRFYVRVELGAGAGEGAPAALYRAMEALTFLRLESSGFSSPPPAHRHEVNFSLKVKEGEMNTSALKLWVMTALMNEGFEFKMGRST